MATYSDGMLEESVNEEPGVGDSFGIDAFTLDDRLRLFHFAAAEKRHEYLWLLRAFDRARANYQVLLHVADARELLAELAEDNPSARAVGEVQPLLDALADWQVLDRSYDGTRAANLAEYRNRHYVYQFTQAGYRAYRAVEEVLGASLEDAQLSRLVFPDILADLRALAAANAAGDAAEVYRKLSRLDAVLADMAQRAARFYLMLGDLARTNDTRPEVFLAHKDALLTHMREFHSELSRFTPLLAEAVGGGCGDRRGAVGGAGRPGRRAAVPFPARTGGGLAAALVRPGAVVRGGGAQRDRAAAGRHCHGDRERHWRCCGGSPSRRRGGVSRESQLRHLAQWFVSCPTDADAHALFQAVFDLGSPRHVSVLHEDPELIPGRTSWWQAPPVELARTLVQVGSRAPAERPRPDRAERRAARATARPAAQGAARQTRTAAAALAGDGVYGRVLDEPETEALLGLLDLALAARLPVPVSRGVRGSGQQDVAAAGAHGVRFTLHPAAGSSTVHTVRGRLHLDRLRLEVSSL